MILGADQVTAQLICAFVFENAKIKFFHDATHMIPFVVQVIFQFRATP